MTYQIQISSQISDISETDWNACANPAALPYSPFLSYGFFKALENSGSVGVEAGWLPQYFTLKKKDKNKNELLGVIPCYLKKHSYGEYVFDNAWADAYARLGLPYYPKLQVSIPFTPATGRRLLVPLSEHAQEHQTLLLEGLVQYIEQHNLSSCHITFLTEPEWHLAEQHEFLKRKDQQFHWENKGYQSFDDFLGSLSSRKRKAIRKERAEALSGDLDIRLITGSDLTEDHWDAFFSFYMDTGSRKWGTPYLTRSFFSLIGKTMAKDILLVFCYRGTTPIAGALNFIGGDTLYGRYWGAIEEHKFLHFEVCYYQAIDYAIANGLRFVEAGAQGPHKLARGYLPNTTYSAHYIANPRLRQAIGNYLQEESTQVDWEQKYLNELSPYAK